MSDAVGSIFEERSCVDEVDASPGGGRERGSGSRDDRSTGKGGKKLGMCGGGLQLSVRGRFRVGDVGLDTGDKGKGGVDGGRGGDNCRPATSWEMEGGTRTWFLPSSEMVASIISTSSSLSSSSSSSSSSTSSKYESGSGAQIKGIDSRSTGSPLASDAEREEQARQYREYVGNHHVPTDP